MALQTEESTALQWAILTDAGNKFCEYDSLDGFVDSNGSDVPTEPQELGKLYSYNKVRQPSEATVSLLFKGDYSKQGAALARLKSYLTSTDVFTIQTPSRALDNMTVVGLSVNRSATKNANMLEVEVTFKEVMSYYQQANKLSPANATSVSTQNGGNVLTSAMDKAQSVQSATGGALDSVTETFNGIKESVSSAVASAKESIESVRSNVAGYIDKARAVQNWARSQMVSVSGEASAIKSTFTVAKEVVSFNGVKNTIWQGVNNARSLKNTTAELLKEVGL